MRKRNYSYLEPTEKQEHLALMEWIRFHPILKKLIIHIPNEGKRSPHEGYQLKKMGLKKGVSDFFLPFPVYPYHGLWIELKKNNKAHKTKEQIEWIDLMRSLNYEAYFAYGFKSAKTLIVNYLKGVKNDSE